jgi:hypothetical protein
MYVVLLQPHLCQQTTQQAPLVQIFCIHCRVNVVCCAAVMIEARHGWGSGGEHGSSGEGEAVRMHSHYWCLGLGVECGQGEV